MGGGGEEEKEDMGALSKEIEELNAALGPEGKGGAIQGHCPSF